jgi:hypothetical protein
MNRCRVCGASLEGRRRPAMTCSASCRRKAARVDEHLYADWERGDYSSVEWADPLIEFGFADGPDRGGVTGASETAVFVGGS